MTEAEVEAVALMALHRHGIPSDVLEMLTTGDSRGAVAPGALRAAIAALDAVRGAGWQPMETAPKDGTHILLLLNRRATIGAWLQPEDEDEGGWYCWQEWFGIARINPNALHRGWMPLPPPPETKP